MRMPSQVTRWAAVVALLVVRMVVMWTQQASCCSTSLSINGSTLTFANCLDLPVQGASIAWTLTGGPSTSSSSDDGDDQQGLYYELEAAFSGTAPSTGGWVGWGLNPDKPQMVGTSAWLAYSAPNGSTLLPYQLTTATLAGTPLKCSPVDYIVKDSAVQISGTAISMLLTLQLNASQPTILNHVWNRGPSVSSFQPAPHSMEANNLKAVARIDMSSGLHVSSPTSSINSLKNRHGVINAIAWAFIFPIGIMIARYLKPFAEPQWFYLHIFLQGAGYVLGVSGWATGLILEKSSHGVVFQKHKYIGMVLFSVSTLQVTALLARPKKEHKMRRCWNVYHHSIGYALVSLGILNVFVGLNILGAPEWTRHALICTLVALGAMALLLECITWFVFLNKQRKEYAMRQKSTLSNESFMLRSAGTFGPTEHILRVV